MAEQLTPVHATQMSRAQSPVPARPTISEEKLALFCIPASVCTLQALQLHCRHCGEDDETGIHIICDCGHFVQHRLNTIGIHQMREDKPEWDMESMLQFLRKEEIILMEDC
jgi:hypothetical protein